MTSNYSFKKEYSNLYDLFYENKNYQKEINLLKKILKKKSNKILELGCGTGNYTKKLENFSSKIIAIDKSKFMIDIAKKKKIKKAKFINKEIKDLKFKEKFDVIVSFFHILSYQANKQELKKFFELSKYLKKGGIFIFDFWFSEGVNYLKPKKTTLLVKKKDYLIRRLSNPNWYKKKRLVSVKYKIDIQYKRKIIKTIKEKHSMKYFSLNEIKDYLDKNNLSLVKNLGQNFISSPNKKDWSVISITRKN
jgi:SAM-dependent methyltransferase